MYFFEPFNKLTLTSLEGYYHLLSESYWVVIKLCFLEFQEAFQLFDNRGDGKIHVAQIGDALRALGQNPTESDVKKYTQQHKPDERVSFEVFLPIYQVSCAIEFLTRVEICMLYYWCSEFIFFYHYLKRIVKITDIILVK